MAKDAPHTAAEPTPTEDQKKEAKIKKLLAELEAATKTVNKLKEALMLERMSPEEKKRYLEKIQLNKLDEEAILEKMTPSERTAYELRKKIAEERGEDLFSFYKGNEKFICFFTGIVIAGVVYYYIKSRKKEENKETTTTNGAPDVISRMCGPGTCTTFKL